MIHSFIKIKMTLLFLLFFLGAVVLPLSAQDQILSGVRVSVLPLWFNEDLSVGENLSDTVQSTIQWTIRFIQGYELIESEEYPADRLSVGILERFIGRRLVFGSVGFQDTGVGADYEVFINDTSLGVNPPGVPRFLTGSYRFKGNQLSRGDTIPLVDELIEVEENQRTTVDFRTFQYGKVLFRRRGPDKEFTLYENGEPWEGLAGVTRNTGWPVISSLLFDNGLYYRMGGSFRLAYRFSLGAGLF